MSKSKQKHDMASNVCCFHKKNKNKEYVYFPFTCPCCNVFFVCFFYSHYCCNACWHLVFTEWQVLEDLPAPWVWCALTLGHRYLQLNAVWHHHPLAWSVCFCNIINEGYVNVAQTANGLCSITSFFCMIRFQSTPRHHLPPTIKNLNYVGPWQ
jgi:hypothetical protein